MRRLKKQADAIGTVLVQCCLGEVQGLKVLVVHPWLKYWQYQIWVRWAVDFAVRCL